MRDLTERENNLLYDKGICPFCLKDEFFEGPSGGMSTNWYCANPDCRAGFNLTPIKGFGGQMIREPKSVELIHNQEGLETEDPSHPSGLSTTPAPLGVETLPKDRKVRWFWKLPRVRGKLRSIVDVLKRSS